MILFNNRPISVGKFPNGESWVDRSFLKHQEDITNVVTLKYENDEDLFRLLLVKTEITFPCKLRITYFPYSRMDRRSDTYAFSLSAVAQFINWMEWDEVIIYEPHSDVTPALLDNLTIVPVTERIMNRVSTIGVPQVFYPDAGAQKRYSHIELKLEPLVGYKTRDFATGRILKSEVIGEKLGDTIIIVDDLCSKGGTFVLAAEKLRKMGFNRIFLVVAHCEKTIFDGLIFETDLIDQVITTDSIISQEDGYRGKGRMRVIPLTELGNA